MFRHRLGLAILITVISLAAPAVAGEPILLRYKFAKGDRLIYKSVEQEQQDQKVLGQDVSTKSTRSVVTSQVVDEVDGDGNAILKTKAVHRKMTSEGPAGKYEFDSKSSERDTASEEGAAITPILERLTGSEYQIKVTPRGEVVEVKGLEELIADLVKDNPFAALQAGVTGDNDGAKYAEQDDFLVFSEKPVEPGDAWEAPFEIELKHLGKIKGTVRYVYEAEDKVGEVKTVRIGTSMEFSLELKLEAEGAKVSGTITSTAATGTAQFDPIAGRVVSAKRKVGSSGQLTIDAGGMVFTIDHTEEQTTTVELLDKLPE
jgi:hypothetical protein